MLYSCKVFVFAKKWLYSGKCDCIRQICCVWAKVAVIGQIDCIRAEECVIRAEVVVFCRGGCI